MVTASPLRRTGFSTVPRAVWLRVVTTILQRDWLVIIARYRTSALARMASVQSVLPLPITVKGVSQLPGDACQEVAAE